MLLAILIVLGPGCQAPRSSSERPASPPSAQQEKQAATLEPAADLPSGAFKASGDKKAPVRLMVYVPGRLGGSPVAFPYDLTMRMIAELQKDYPGKIRAEVYAIDTKEGMQLLKNAHLGNPSVVMTIRRSGKEGKRQIFDMISDIGSPLPAKGASELFGFIIV